MVPRRPLEADRSRTMASYHLLLYAVSLQYSVRHSSIACVVQILKPKPALCTGTFEAQLLGMDEVPDRAIIDLEATLGEFRYQPTDCEVLLRTRCTSHSRCSPEIAFGLWPPILSGATLPVSRSRRTYGT